MRCCCESIVELLPPDAARWLRVADDYRAGLVPPIDLLAARLDAWDHLGPKSCDFALPRVNAVRAVIFLLFPDEDSAFEDAFLVTSHFVDFCEDAGMPSELQCRCLAKAYGLSLGGQADA